MTNKIKKIDKDSLECSLKSLDKIKKFLKEEKSDERKYLQQETKDSYYLMGLLHYQAYHNDILIMMAKDNGYKQNNLLISKHWFIKALHEYSLNHASYRNYEIEIDIHKYLSEIYYAQSIFRKSIHHEIESFQKKFYRRHENINNRDLCENTYEILYELYHFKKYNIEGKIYSYLFQKLSQTTHCNTFLDNLKEQIKMKSVIVDTELLENLGVQSIKFFDDIDIMTFGLNIIKELKLEDKYKLECRIISNKIKNNA